MEVVGLRDLNHNLSAIMARVAAGASLVITDRGKPIADLTPHQAETSSIRNQLIADGLLKPARRSRGRLPSLRPELSALPNSADMLAVDREKDRER